MVMVKREEETIAQMSEASVTDEILTERENDIGIDLRVSNIFNSTVSYEAIRNFCNGIGDSNPLYRENDYARDTSYERKYACCLANWL